jgi:hypothetical protein
MCFEYDAALKHFGDSGILSSHDVIGSFFRRNAFTFFSRKNRLERRVFNNIGIALYTKKTSTVAR